VAGMLREPEAPAGILRKRVAAVAAYAALSHQRQREAEALPTLLEAGLEIKNQDSRDSTRPQHVRRQHVLRRLNASLSLSERQQEAAARPQEAAAQHLGKGQ
jgi:hypothetical protein